MVALPGVLLFLVSSLSCGWEVGVEPVGDASGLVDHLRRVASGPVRWSVLCVVVGGGLLAQSCRRGDRGVVFLVSPHVVNDHNSAGGPAIFGELESEGQQALVVSIADEVGVQLGEEEQLLDRHL